MLIDKLEKRAAYLNRHDEFRELPTATYAETTRRIELDDTIREGHAIELKLGVSYWCYRRGDNSAEYKQARRKLCHYIYQDLEMKLEEVRHAIWDHDKTKALKIMGEIQTLINGGES
jgi:uncharacterized protein YbaP (TraB family)